MLLQAREIFNLSKTDIWHLPDGPMQIRFEDGVLDTTARATIFSWYCAVYHRLYPKTPLLMANHLGNRLMSTTAHLTLLELGLWGAADTYNNRLSMEKLSLIAYQTTNEIYNDFTVRLRQYVNTLNILDLIEVMDNPTIKNANDNVKPTQSSIDSVYSTIMKTLETDLTLRGNTVAKMARYRLVSQGQLVQCLGPRGYLTDIDSNIFKKPILTGYVDGINTLADSMMESRSASKALLFQKDPVALSEYFNRELQLMTSIVTRIHKGDCGSKEYIPFKVKPEDIQRLVGKYYKNEFGGITEIRKDDRHLVGNLLELRSALKCKHSDSYGVCEKCYGKIAESLPEGTNIGHFSSTNVGEKISQSVLSVKHLDGSSKVDDLEISDHDSRYIRAITETKKSNDKSDDVTYIKLATRLNGANVKLVIAATNATNLSDIEYYELDKLVPSSISNVREILLITETVPETFETVVLPVSTGSRTAWLSNEALIYIKDRGWTLTEKGDYKIDLLGWDVDLPLFELPMVHTNMVAYMQTIKKTLKSLGNTTRVNNVAIKPSVEVTLMDLYKLVNQKLNVNIVHLEILILSSMSRDPGSADHRLPRPIKNGELSNYVKNMEMRSCGTSMAYQRQSKILKDYSSFVNVPRPDSPFDTLLCPFPQVNPSE